MTGSSRGKVFSQFTMEASIASCAAVLLFGEADDSLRNPRPNAPVTGTPRRTPKSLAACNLFVNREGLLSAQPLPSKPPRGSRVARSRVKLPGCLHPRASSASSLYRPHFLPDRPPSEWLKSWREFSLETLENEASENRCDRTG